jgi:hypothetical protein
VHQGVSAHCITPAYSLLPVTYYGIFWASKFISMLAIDNNIVKNILVIIAATCTQWFVATSSYYFFTTTYGQTGWRDFPAYVAKWSMIEIPTTLSWMAIIIITFTLVPRISPALKLQKSACVPFKNLTIATCNSWPNARHTIPSAEEDLPLPLPEHVVITGRTASEGLIKIADTVSKIADTKHAFRSNIRAQKGIDL